MQHGWFGARLEVDVRNSTIKDFIYTNADVSAFFHGLIHVRRRNPLPQRSNHVIGYNPLPKLLYLSLPFFVLSHQHLCINYHLSPLRIVSPVYSIPSPASCSLAYPQHPSSYHFNVCI